MTTRSDRVPVAIVGGGASGTIVAAQLAKRGVRSILIDGSGRMGRGVAYSTTEPAHLLNVRADGMSAWAGDPDHFVRAFEAEGGDTHGFAQRRFFGTYLRRILDEAIEAGCTKPVEATVVSSERRGGSWHLTLDDRGEIEAQALVLAIGNQEPDALGAFRGIGRRWIGNPWGVDARAAVEDLAQNGGTAMLIGTGLTMVDLVLSLDAAGHPGPILALSRRGLAPRSHADFEPAPVELDEVPAGSVRMIWRWLKRRGADVGWRAAIDSLRPHSHALWQGLDADEQRRFLRHARPWWDVHRHRIAPEVGATVTRLVAEGRLQIVAGRIVSAEETADALDVQYRRRGSTTVQSLSAAYAFNCTGPLHSITHTKDSLLRSLLDAGEVNPDHLGIGIEVSGTCRAGKHLWAMGPLTKGRYWEIIAVPDIREQAAQVADDIQRELGA
ncbi:MAG: FAD/NAD(P)-binding protein [Sphingomicrobium sp.]